MRTDPNRRRARAVVAGAILTTAAALALSATDAGATSTTSPAPVPSSEEGLGGLTSSILAGRYVVVLRQEPLATYAGGVSGLHATQPARGEHVDVTSRAAQEYRAHLAMRQNTVAASVGAQVDQRYTTSLDGFSAELTGAQVAELRSNPGVLTVAPDTLQTTSDDKVPTDFLKLSGRSGVWKSMGGQKTAGAGVVVGVIDTGIWPESASLDGARLKAKPPKNPKAFAPYRSGDAIVMHKADGGTFRGTCQVGEDFTADDCNSKLISARYFGQGWLGQVPPEGRDDYVSPRDGAGHGTHTATTAAGNAGVVAVASGIRHAGLSGIAPGAKIAAYKVLWTGKDGVGTGGTTSDVLAAIDQAVADGVDVINYSVGSIFESAKTDPIQLSFLHAASTGIFVSAAAGNSGPWSSTLDNTSPWVTTVGASTVAPYAAAATLGNGKTFTGVSTSIDRPISAPLVTGPAVKVAGVPDLNASYCMPGTLDPALAAGKIVACSRGITARVEKSAEVDRVGGVAVMVLNTTHEDLMGDSHVLPTLSLDTPGSLEVLEYAATTGATARLATTTTTTPYPQIAEFSSRGPSLSNSDLIKPDLAAPGVNVLAAVSPPTNQGQNFAFYSGTSMAAPHIAGIAALYLGRHPRWSPMAVKSALMTTAGRVKTSGGGTDRDPFSGGAGEVRPSRMLTPGLVYDAGRADWLGYLEGSGVGTGTGVKPIDPSDYNNPSIAVQQLVGTQTVTRRVTAVKTGTYRATLKLPGMKVKVTPQVLSFGRVGQTRKFTVRVTQDTARSGRYAIGSLTWKGAGTTVRSPIAVVPHSVLAPALVAGNGTDGQVTFEATSSAKGQPILPHGLVSGPIEHSTTRADAPDADLPRHEAVADDRTDAIAWTIKADDPGASMWGALYTVEHGRIKLISWQGDGSSSFTTSLTSPMNGTWGLFVLTLTEGGDVPYTVQTDLVDDQSTGMLTVTPTTSPAAGTPYQVTGSWTGASTDRHATGFLEWPNGEGTVISVN